MLDNVKYINHLGETITFGKESGIYINYNDLRDFAWVYDSKFNRIKNLRRTPIVTKSIPLILCSGSEEEGIQKKNELYEIMEKDVLANQYGKFVIGDYYLQCYITESKKANYLKNKGYLEVTLKASTDKGFWIKEEMYMFYANPEGEESTEGFYEYDYPYDYHFLDYNKKIENDELVGCDFAITINGAATNPKVQIGTNVYELKYTIRAGEYVVIDSRTKTIILHRLNGDEINLFSYQSWDSYIFEKIATGSNAVTWNGTYDIAITLFHERGEPKWM